MPDEPTPPEATTPNSESDPRYDSAGVPTFESVREKIETRYGTALGATELDAEKPARPPARRSVRAAAARGSRTASSDP